VDIAAGDVIRYRGGDLPRLIATKKSARGEVEGYDEKCNIMCRKQDGSGNKGMHFMVHHLVLDALDPRNCLFELVQRFTTFCGYLNRKTSTLGRPKDNCHELQEMLDPDGDGLGGACKTDGDHTLGYGFQSLWGLWKSHHAVNQWLHHIRKRAGYWLHPYTKEKYAEKQEDRQFPTFYERLPKTLAEERKPLRRNGMPCKHLQ
jgi:hypothetical protein